jgi:AraC family transcriptional regulator of adaptative response/methylated-DNA-[protein]-cysteine methyltransferase
MPLSAYGDEEAQWEAVLGRAPAADGAFVYAVKTTGIYCRPTCPSRRPGRSSVSFFDSLDLAELAGFRPCRRCRPKEASTQQRVVAQVQHLLDSLETPPSLEQLGQEIGLSPFHLQRLFKRATGLSPRAYAAARRAERLKQELRQGANVTTAMYDAGYSSPRALYETAHKHFGMSPGAYRRGGQGIAIRYAVADTPLGRMLLAATDKGICSLRFGEDEPLVAELRTEFPKATLVEDPLHLQTHVMAVCDYLVGRRRHLDLPLDVYATEFQQKVWTALQAIPYGETRSYRHVAELIGNTKAVRAVARACATNPVALVVPCHRVVRTGGDLSGYRWGIDRKRKLLDQERNRDSG